jgi:hypothetical protein
MFASLILTGVALWLVVGAVVLANGGHITQDRARAMPKAMAA